MRTAIRRPRTIFEPDHKKEFFSFAMGNDNDNNDNNDNNNNNYNYNTTTTSTYPNASFHFYRRPKSQPDRTARHYRRDRLDDN